MEVLRKSAPPRMAASARRAISSGEKYPVSRITLSTAWGTASRTARTSASR